LRLNVEERPFKGRVTRDKEEGFSPGARFICNHKSAIHVTSVFRAHINLLRPRRTLCFNFPIAAKI